MHNLLTLEFPQKGASFFSIMKAGSYVYKVIHMKRTKMHIPFVFDKYLWNLGNYGRIIPML